MKSNMNGLVLYLMVGLVAVAWGQEEREPLPIRLNRTCDVPRRDTLFPVTVFTANTTAMVKTTRSLMKLSKRVFRGGKSIKEGRKANATNASSWIVNTKGWVDLCPEKPTYIQPKHWFVYAGRLCITPLPWRNFRYPTVGCQYRSCQLVNRPMFFCRPSVRRVYVIPIYCFNAEVGKFVKELFNIYTYRYCTCCRYGCPITDTLTSG